MSRLLSALKNLEKRTPPAAPIAPPVPPPVTGPKDAATAVAQSPSSPRIRPRRSVQRPETLFAGNSILSDLATQPTPRRQAEKQSLPIARSAPVATEYELAPAVIVNEAALVAGADFAQQLATATFDPAEMVNQPVVVENFSLPVPAELRAPPAPLESALLPPKPVSLLRTPTPLETRIRENLSHPTRSRHYVDLVERLRQDFAASDSRSLLFTGIGQASRGDEMLAHVAAVFAEQGSEVLLVDADFERVSLTAGLANVTLGGLQNSLGTSGSWKQHVVPTSIPRLSLLPAGRGNLNVKDAIAPLARLLEELETDRRLVLIDGGQSTGTLLSALARLCDATYFVIRLGATDAKEAEAALARFRSCGARVMGCVAVMANDQCPGE